MSAITFSLHIGVNSLDTNHYSGWDGKLQGCENDARFYYQLAQREQVKFSQLLLSGDPSIRPTSDRVLSFLDKGITELNEGDNLIITYSGHGGTVEDKNNEEDDFQDETWCLYDRQLLDDELLQRFDRFKAGVNIFVISDSCHSGTISKGEKEEQTPPAERLRRFVPRDKLFDTFNNNKGIYERYMRLPIVRGEEIKASVLQLGACQDDESAMEDGPNGLFTKTIMRILERNAEISSYEELLLRSKRALTGIQQPNLLSYGFNHEHLLRIKPLGSSYHEGSAIHTPFIKERGTLIIECGSETIKLDAFPGFEISQTLPVPGKEGYVRYHCSCALAQSGMYPWDHAYDQYRWLKERSFPVSLVEPENITDTTLPVMDSVTTNKMVALLLKVFRGRMLKQKGVGKQKDTEDDELLLTMFALETIGIIMKDEDLKTVAALDIPTLEVYLQQDANLINFRSLVKQSFFCSNTLNAHM